MPAVEHEPHLRVMYCTRTCRGWTFSRRAQDATRSRMTARRSSGVRIGACPQNAEDALYDAAPFVPL